MTRLWLWGTMAPLALWLYAVIGRAAYGFALKRWPDLDDTEFNGAMFGVFWPVTVSVWALARWVVIPAWRATAWAQELGAKATKEADDA